MTVLDSGSAPLYRTHTVWNADKKFLVGLFVPAISAFPGGTESSRGGSIFSAEFIGFEFWLLPSCVLYQKKPALHL
jgi:hypothetical protein